MFRVNNRNNRKKGEICSKSTIKTERRQLHRIAKDIGPEIGHLFNNISLREKCPNTQFYLVRIFLYVVNLRIQSEYRKIRTRKNSAFVVVRMEVLGRGIELKNLEFKGNFFY